LAGSGRVGNDKRSTSFLARFIAPKVAIEETSSGPIACATKPAHVSTLASEPD
jgi:hypothetical protein